MSNFTPESGGLDGTPHQVTNISTGADGAIWSPDGKNIVFVSSVYPDCEGRRVQQATRRGAREEQGEGEDLHQAALPALGFVHRIQAQPSVCRQRRGRCARSRIHARDLTPGDHDVPPFNLGGQDMYAVSPDGQEVAYTSNVDEVEATSTNNEIFLVPMTGGTPKKISTSPGNDDTPIYSPDGNHLAWRSMARAGFEADKSSLIIYQRKLGESRNATQTFDRSVDSLTWTPDSKAIFFTAEDQGEMPIYALPLDAKATEGSRPVACRRPRLLQRRE